MKKIQYIDNMQIYRIEGVVDFNPENNTLSAVSKNIEISLLSAASSVLLTLIKNHGQLVRQKDLIHEGWEKHGLHVSSNTFYQNILTIRKGIRQCGISAQVLKTVPRKGLTIPLTISINKVVKHEKSILSKSEAEVSNIYDSVSNSRKEEQPLFINKNRRPGSTLIIYLVCGFLGFSIGIYSGLFKNYTVHYRHIDLINGCQVFAGKDNNILTSYESFLHTQNITCNANESIYFTTFQYIPRTSIIKCSHSLEHGDKNNSCVSLYYLDK